MAQIDHALFLLFNKTLALPAIDPFMIFMTRSHTLVQIFILLLSLYLLSTLVITKNDTHYSLGFFPKQILPALILISSALLVYALSDAIPHRIIKPIVGRLRPCNPNYFIDGVHQFLTGGRFLLGTKTSLSMPSIHALSSFTQALFWGTLFPKSRWWLLAFAAFIAYTRVYVGVHYPGDILVGALLGSALGFGWARLTQHLFSSYLGLSQEISTKELK